MSGIYCIALGHTVVETVVSLFEPNNVKGKHWKEISKLETQSLALPSFVQLSLQVARLKNK